MLEFLVFSYFIQVDRHIYFPYVQLMSRKTPVFNTRKSKCLTNTLTLLEWLWKTELIENSYIVIQ